MGPAIEKYGSHERHQMAIWPAPSGSSVPAVLWFHGGGFQKGDPLGIPPERPALTNSLGVTFVSATYRLRPDDVTRGDIMMDGALALQFLRRNAKELSIDPQRIAVCGGSAGGHIAGWLAYHPDIADSTHEDPVRRESSRVTAVGLVNTQPVPRNAEAALPYLDVDQELVEQTLGKFQRDRAEEQLREVWFKAPFHPRDFASTEEFVEAREQYYRNFGVFDHANNAAPPTFFVTAAAVPPDAAQLLRTAEGTPIEIDLHHPALMLPLHNKLKSLGVETVWSSSFDDMLRFLCEKIR